MVRGSLGGRADFAPVCQPSPYDVIASRCSRRPLPSQAHSTLRRQWQQPALKQKRWRWFARACGDIYILCTT